jgi:hypothetical protein
MDNIWEKVILVLAGNLNWGRSYLITTAGSLISLENSTTGIAILVGLELGTSVDLVQSLGLDISSSSADESSPIKKQQKTENRKKRKRPLLGFSAQTGPETFHSPAKRKNVSKW